MRTRKRTGGSSFFSFLGLGSKVNKLEPHQVRDILQGVLSTATEPLTKEELLGRVKKAIDAAKLESVPESSPANKPVNKPVETPVQTPVQTNAPAAALPTQAPPAVGGRKLKRRQTKKRRR